MDQELNNLVFQQEEKLFQIWYPESFMRILGADCIIATLGSFHKHMRSLVLKLLGPENLRLVLLHDVQKATRASLLSWLDLPSIELKEATSSMIFSVTSKRLISYDSSSSDGKLWKQFDAFTRGLIAFPIYVPGTAFYKCMQGRKNVMKILTKMLDERKRASRQDSVDFLDLLIDDLKKEKLLKNEKIALDLLFLLLFAGFETTSSGITAALKFLTDDPKALQELTEEHEGIRKRRVDPDSEITWEEYKSMKFTSHVIHEALRLSNIAPVMFRKAREDFHVKGYTIPKGSKIMINPSSVHLDPTVYNDPNEFNPWRWKGTSEPVGGASKEFMAFGGGVRLCVGADFAKLQMAIFLHCLELTPLKIQSHGASSVMHYDERYTPYIEMTGLLPFMQLVSRSTPNLNAAAVTSLIDRWRSETHSFHLRTGEMTVTLQDVSMITALPIEGKPLCMSTDSEGWRQKMEALIDDEVIQRYARVYMWYVISRTIFADGTGKNAPWMWLKALTVFDNKFSWGSAALAYFWTMLVAGRQRTVELVVVCSYFQYGAGNAYLLDALKAHSGIPEMTTATLYGNLHGLTSGTWLDRRRQRKIKDWQKHHKSYVVMFEQSVQATSSIQRTQYRQHCALAFSNYLRWFQESTRVEICPPAYEEDILEEPTEYDALAQGGYSKFIREGYQTSFAPVLNFVRKEVKKQADESEDILDNTTGGQKGESALRLFIKEQGKKLQRLSNILGCRDPEYVSPSRSGSSERNTLDDSASSGARMDDGDITSAANTQRNTQEDDVDTPQAANDMTLKAFQRSAYMLKPRKEFKRYSPDDYAKGKNPVARGSRLSRMRSMDDEVEDDDDDELDDPEQFVVARRKKLVSKRGRGPK
ncbi:Cytochrome P450 87A3 [Hordeum vulgare]|nr:Cytochrome P450 87A3 [Hordeum vulgare]